MMDWRNSPAPTHRCKICFALWRFWPKRDTGNEDSWSLISNFARACCESAPMGEQIVPLTMGQMESILKARLAVDEMFQMAPGQKLGNGMH
jgi:hypothetical protein